MDRRWLSRSLLPLLSTLVACGASPAPAPSDERAALVPCDPPAPGIAHAEPTAIEYVDSDHQSIADSEAHAAPGGRRVLETAGAMIDEDVVVVGSCWDWAEAVFTRAGGASHQVFHGRQSGPWADTATLQPGDWLYFIHTDGGGTHSAIFVAWLDAPHHVGLTVSYAGGHAEEAARYGSYDLSRVFRVVRMDD